MKKCEKKGRRGDFKDNLKRPLKEKLGPDARHVAGQRAALLDSGQLIFAVFAACLCSCG